MQIGLFRKVLSNDVPELKGEIDGVRIAEVVGSLTNRFSWISHQRSSHLLLKSSACHFACRISELVEDVDIQNSCIQMKQKQRSSITSTSMFDGGIMFPLLSIFVDSLPCVNCSPPLLVKRVKFGCFLNRAGRSLQEYDV